MEIIYVLIPIAMVFVVLAVAAFFWAVKTDQYSDFDREAINILFDEEKVMSKLSNTNSNTHKRPSKKESK